MLTAWDAFTHEEKSLHFQTHGGGGGAAKFCSRLTDELHATTSISSSSFKAHAPN